MTVQLENSRHIFSIKNALCPSQQNTDRHKKTADTDVNNFFFNEKVCWTLLWPLLRVISSIHFSTLEEFKVFMNPVIGKWTICLMLVLEFLRRCRNTLVQSLHISLQPFWKRRTAGNIMRDVQTSALWNWKEKGNWNSLK